MTVASNANASAPTSQPDANQSATTPPAATPAPQGSLLVGDNKPAGSDQGQAGGENKTTPSQPAAEVEIKLPDGFVADEALLKDFGGLAKDVGLDSEKASKLAAWFSEKSTAAMKAMEDAQAKQAEDWKAEAKADPEFGGAKFSDTIAKAQSAVTRFGDDAFKKELNESGLGNHPAFIRFCAKVGRAIAEDSSGVKPVPGGQVELTEAERNKLRYDKSH